MCRKCIKKGVNCNGYVEKVLKCPGFKPLGGYCTTYSNKEKEEIKEIKK